MKNLNIFYLKGPSILLANSVNRKCSYLNALYYLLSNLCLEAFFVVNLYFYFLRGFINHVCTKSFVKAVGPRNVVVQMRYTSVCEDHISSLGSLF